MSGTYARRLARTAGWFYLLIFASGAVGFASYEALVSWDDPTAMVAGLRDSEAFWRLGTSAMLVMLVSDVVLAVLFYELLRPVSGWLSVLAACFRLVLVPVLAGAVLARYLPLLVLEPAAADALGPEAAQALVQASLRLFEHGFTVALVFFGFHCLLLGWLIARSRYLPRWLGVLLGLAGLLYILDSFRMLTWPGLAPPFDMLLACYAVELLFCLWLIVFGLDPEQWPERAQAAN